MGTSLLTLAVIVLVTALKDYVSKVTTAKPACRPSAQFIAGAVFCGLPAIG
jgi:hypothetical protein